MNSPLVAALLGDSKRKVREIGEPMVEGTLETVRDVPRSQMVLLYRHPCDPMATEIGRFGDAFLLGMYDTGAVIEWDWNQFRETYRRNKMRLHGGSVR